MFLIHFKTGNFRKGQPPLPVSCSGCAQQKGAELKRSVEPGSKRSEETRSRLRKVAMTTGWQELMEPEAEKHPQETEARTDTRTQTPIHAVVFFFHFLND